MTAACADTTIVVAALDEGPTIGRVVERCLPFAAEVIVVDGRSRDGTAELARRAGARVLIDHGKGKGDAIRTAIPEVRTPIAVFLDADQVGASRLIGGSSELHGGFDEFLRLAGSAFITACVNRRYGVRLSDTQNGFRAIRTDVLRALALSENGTTIEQEMVMKALAAGFRVAEVASHERARTHGRSHIRVWRVMPRYAFCLTVNLLRPLRPVRPTTRAAPAPAPLATPAGRRP